MRFKFNDLIFLKCIVHLFSEMILIVNDKGEADLELLAEMETSCLPPTFPRFEQRFLEHLQVTKPLIT